MMANDEWQTRALCDDGACIGVIGADGTCRTCGRAAAYWGDERRRGQRVDAGGDDDGGDSSFAERELCPDGACTGVIGADGTCGVCGARAEPAAPVAAVAVTPPSVARASDDEDDEDRRLCPDGACIGLLDAAGVCKVCGQADVGN